MNRCLTNNMKLKTIRFLMFGILTLTIISCTKICNVDCFTPPGDLRLKITNEADSTDLIFTGVYNADSIAIFYLDNNVKRNIELSIYTDSVNQRSMISSAEIAWKSVEGFKDYFLYLNWEEVDTLYLDVVSATENCCTYHPFIYFGINGTETEFDTTDYMYDFKK